MELSKKIIYLEEVNQKILTEHENLILELRKEQSSINETYKNKIKELNCELDSFKDKNRKQIDEIEKKYKKTYKTIEREKIGQLDFDYFAFEQQFRGSREAIKAKQSNYVNYFVDKTSVLDLGCGRGEFVELLVEKGINVTGIDSNDAMINYCKNQGLPVIKEDVFEYLSSLNDESVDGIFAAQVIEHLNPKSFLRLINLAYSKLSKEGILILETINPENLNAVANWFYMDLSHIRPIHPETAKFAMQSKGFSQVELIYLNPELDKEIPRLNITDTESNVSEFNHAISKLNKSLFGPQDYAVIGKK